MTTQSEGLAETPAVDTAATETESHDNGIIDFDALSGEQPVSDIEDGNISTEEPDPKDTPEAAAKEQEAEEKKKLSGAQRAKIREQRLLDEIAARDRELETLKGKGKDAGMTASDEPKPPKEEDFNGDYFAFTKAAAAFDAAKAARDAVRSEFETRQNAESQREASKVAQQRRLDHAERVETAKEVIADFDAVMEGMKGVNVRDDVIEEIMASPNSAVVTYHLAKNPNELEALNRLPPKELARAMGRLEATLKLPEPKMQTSAPAPLSQRKGAAPASKSQEQVLSGWLKKTYG